MKSSKVNRRTCPAVSRVVEALESRCLLSAAVLAQIPAQSVSAGQTFTPIALSPYFQDSAIPAGDTVVNIQTNLPAPNNSIPLVLTDAATPQTVTNFLSYITNGEYANSVVHRSVPGFIIQAGGYATDGSHIPVIKTIPGESSTATLKNTTGTIAMALSTGPDSGTSEWFINLGNNPQLDDTSDGGPFTAFGQVIYNGLSVADNIASLKIVNDQQSGAWTNLPVQNFSGTTGATVSTVPPSDLVTINPVIVPGGLTYTVTSSDPALVTGTVSNGALTLNDVGTGTANVTVTATDLGGGTISNTFAVTAVNPSPTATIGTGAAKSLTYTNANGTTGIVTLKGPGTATLSFAGSGITQTTGSKGITVSGTGVNISDIATTGTTAASTLTFTTKGGTKAINVGNITTDSLKSIVGKGVTLTGNVSATGAIGTLQIAGAQGGAISAASIGSLTTSGSFDDNLSLGSTSVSLNKFKAGTIAAGAWNLAGSANSISATSATGWTANIAQSVKTVAIKGDLTATISTGSISSLSVKGSLADSAFALTAAGNDLNKLSVGGSISNTTLNATGSIGTVAAGSLVNSTIDAGVGNLVVGQALPNSATDFLTIESIKSVTLKKATSGDSFSNSDIAAANLGKLSLGTLLTSNNGNVTGVAAEGIQSLTATANKKFSVKKLTTASNVTATLTTEGVTLGDFVIKLF